jgi:uridine kinase
MKNLLNTLSQDLQNKLSDYKVSFICLDDYNELNTVSEYDMDSSYYSAIESELVVKGFEVC